jgi:site-specific DNA-methyltransferase (adenine-specific)
MERGARREVGAGGPRIEIVQAENLAWLRARPEASFALAYVDPPFGTGRRRVQRRLRTEAVERGGDRRGFGGREYRTTVLGEMRWDDPRAGWLELLRPRLAELRRVLEPEGSLFVHLDPRGSHYAKVLLDLLFGTECFRNEIVWAYDFGGRSARRWPAKHDVILWYSKHPRRWVFRREALDRIPYLAPGLVGEEKARRGKTPTDVWWNTIVSPTGRERTGYPTQKPLAIVERLLRVHAEPGARVLDCYAGSGTTGEAAARLGLDCTLVDENPEALAVMERRLAFAGPRVVRPARARARAPR